MTDLEQMRARKNAAYDERNLCVIAMAKLAQNLGYKVYRAMHPESDASWERDWVNILFIELPTGQVSWHFHDRHAHLLKDFEFGPNDTWDGHTTEEKYERLGKL